MLKPPGINIDKVPADERGAALHISLNLTRMELAVGQLREAITLSNHGYEQAEAIAAALCHITPEAFELGKQQQLLTQMMSWGSMGARQGVLLIHGFMRTKQFTDKLLGPCKYMASHVDRSLQKQSNALFARSFPTISDLRHTVAHPGEFGASPEGFAKDAIVGGFSKGGLHIEEGSSVIVDGNMIGSEYCSSIDGKMVSYEVSQATADIVEKVAQLYFTAFCALE